MFRFTVLTFSLIVLSLSSAVMAQKVQPSPKLFHGFPSGGQAGTTVEIVIAGTDLDSADGLWFSDPGVKASAVAAKPKTFRVSISSQLPPGNLDFRAITPEGVSNPRTFVVSSRPEFTESEPNNNLALSMPITINSVVNGSCTPIDVDCFSFDGKKGQRISAQVAAESIESKLEATFRLIDSQGVEISESHDALGNDPFLEFTLPKDSRYYIKIHDVTYKGSPEHFYRLTLDDGPRIDAIFPPIALIGGAGKATLIGQNLTELTSLRAFPEFKEETVSPLFRTTADLPINYPGSSAALRGYVVRAMDKNGPSNPIVLTEAEGPIVSEREPNAPACPQIVNPPCSIGGDFRTTGDIDTYRFRAKKGEIWRIEAISEGIGSPADPSITIQRVPDQGEPTDLATADDTPDPGLSPRFNLASVDATLRWSVPSDGWYQIVLNDVAGSSRSDPRLFYRMSIRRERPDFRLFLVPTTPNVLDSVTLRQGGRKSAMVLAWRLDGFTGPIWIVANGLPAGVHVDRVVIPAGQVSAPIVFETEAEAKPTVGLVKLVGLGSTSVTAHPKADSILDASVGFNLRNEAIAGSVVWPPVKLPNSQRTPAAIVRASRGFVVAIRPGSPFQMTARPKHNAVALGQTIDLEITAQRSFGFDEPISLTAVDVPTGFAVPTGSFAKGISSTHLSWSAPKTVASGIYSLVIRGKSTYKSDPKATAYLVDEPSNPIVITVRPAPFTLSTSSKPTIKPGQLIEFDIKLDRQDNFHGPVTLAVEAPAGSKLDAPPLTIAAGQSSAHLAIRSAKEVPIGPLAFNLHGEAMIESEIIEIALRVVATIIKP